MKKNSTLLTALMCSLLPGLGAGSVSMPFDLARQRVNAQPSDYIFAGHLMSSSERNEFRRTMRQSKTEHERKELQRHHRERMMERAKEMDPDMWKRYQR